MTLPLFWIAKFPVTNGRYALSVSMTRRQPPRGWDGVEPPIYPCTQLRVAPG